MSAGAFFLDAPHGHLECLAASPDGAVVGAAIVCHPHPVHGGTMHTKAVHALHRGLIAAGIATLRFNFRGVGRSTGSFDHGVGELEDARLVAHELRRRWPQAPLWVAGFSFGSWIATRLAGELERPAGLILMAPPFARYDYGDLAARSTPILLLHGAEDELAELARAEDVFATLAAPRAMVIFEGAGHLFLEALASLSSAVTAAVRRWPPTGHKIRLRPTDDPTGGM